MFRAAIPCDILVYFRIAHLLHAIPSDCQVPGRDPQILSLTSLAWCVQIQRRNLPRTVDLGTTGSDIVCIVHGPDLFYSSFKLVLELDPQIRDIVFAFYESNYSKCLSLLQSLRDHFLLDLFLSPHVEKLYSKIRNRSLIQVRNH